ncbi:hypothetical protein [Candidatus Clostridium stratigraminis]|uniref:Nucleotidyl transferase AbiEii toxin, Type IV TA system n=1 Tax=Candidatus Clostridium stratigraminis TaxID=3381661 RepID=A0ABW8TCF2_9CLOT
MLNKVDIVKIIKDMKLPLSEYWITSGAGLVLHGVKETTRDIDLGCTTYLVERYLRKGEKDISDIKLIDEYIKNNK